MNFDTNEAFYNRIADSYDLIAHSSERESTEKGLAALAPEAGERILEIGYGTGHALVTLAKATGESGEVCGIDVSSGMQKVARDRVEKEGLADRVRLSVGSVPPLPYEDESFDGVFLSFTLELFPPDVIGEVAREIRRVLKPGGRCGIVAMAVPRSEDEDTPLEKAYVWMHRHFPHIVDCHPINTEKIVEGAGMRVIHQEHLDIWTLPVAIVVAEKL